VFLCWRSLEYGIFFLYLEFRNRFIFIAMIRCFSRLFVYLFCVSFPFRWLSFSKVDSLFEFLLALFCLKFLWFLLVWFVIFVRFYGLFRIFRFSFKVLCFYLQFDFLLICVSGPLLAFCLCFIALLVFCAEFSCFLFLSS